MARAEAWKIGVCGLCALCAITRTTHASSEFSTGQHESGPLLARIELALLGEAKQDPALFERIRSLFSAQTQVLQRDVDRIEQSSVLLPQRTDTVYIWIRVSERNARVYLALGEAGGPARYLFREVALDAGVDEVAGETLAEIAHSSAQALWLRKLQTPRQTLVEALAREVDTPQVALPPVVTKAIHPVTVPESRDTGPPPEKHRIEAGASSIRIGLGASETAHTSSAEGWLHEPGGFLTFEFRARLSLRVAARYLVATDFDLPPARVSLSGPSTEVRGGWLSSDAGRVRLRLELGLGLFLGRAQASIAVEQPKAHALAAQDFARVYALAAGALEWPLGPAWLAAGADLRMPLQATSYEIGGQDGARVSPALCPGGSLELGIGFDP